MKNSFGVILFELLHGTLPWLIEPDHDNLHDLAEYASAETDEAAHKASIAAALLKDMLQAAR